MSFCHVSCSSKFGCELSAKILKGKGVEEANRQREQTFYSLYSGCIVINSLAYVAFKKIRIHCTSHWTESCVHYSNETEYWFSRYASRSFFRCFHCFSLSFEFTMCHHMKWCRCKKAQGNFKSMQISIILHRSESYDIFIFSNRIVTLEWW